MALLLRDVVGLSYSEIADSLEVTLSTVKWRIWKAREDVQLSLAREGIEVFEDREVAELEVAAVVPVLAPPDLPISA
jgi:predicted RNA polymerase sigma factor